MPTQYRLPVHPEGAQEVNATVAIHRSHGQVAYFAAGVPVFCHAETDPVGRRLAAVQLDALGLATQAELQAALGLHRTTLFRSARKVQAGGVAGLLGQRLGDVASGRSWRCDAGNMSRRPAPIRLAASSWGTLLRRTLTAAWTAGTHSPLPCGCEARRRRRVTRGPLRYLRRAKRHGERKVIGRQIW